MGKIKSSKEEDIALFNQILKDNIAMLIGKSDKFAIDLFASKILDGIGEVRIYDWNEFDEIINERVYGYVDYISENTQVMVYGTTGYTGDIEFIEKLFSDVIWHILMVYFCKSYGSHFKRKLFLKQGTVEVSNYAGFLKSEIEQGIATSGSMMIDNLTRLLALAVIKKRNDSNFIIDDVFKKGVGDKQKTSPFDNLLCKTAIHSPNLAKNLSIICGVREISGTNTNALFPFSKTFSINCKYTSVLPEPVTPFSKNSINSSFSIINST